MFIKRNIFFLPTRLDRTRGHKLGIAKVETTKVVRSNIFSQRVINNWNSLPEKSIKSDSLNTLKNRLDDV